MTRMFLRIIALTIVIGLTACATPPTTTPQPTSPSAPTAMPHVTVPASPVPTRAANMAALPKLYDGHLHYSQDAWAGYPIDSIKSILDHVGISRALVSSTPNDGTVRLHQADPARIVPEVRPYRTRADMETWFNDPAIVTFIEQELKRGIYRGIGEFHLYGDGAKTATVKRIVDLAVERNLPLHAHSDEAAIEALFAANPRVKVMWAHTGMSAPTATVEKMLERYPNLWAELSYRSDIFSGGKLSPEWRALFTRFPNRFVYGSDTWIESRWAQLPSLITDARGWLAELPSEIAANVAYRNFETLYGQ